jgi:hypothetical protein
MAKETLYTGNGNKHPKFDGSISFSHSRKQVELLLANLNEKGYVNTLISSTKDDPTKFYEKIDTYGGGKKQQRNEEQVEAERQNRQPNDKIDDLPF